MRVGILTSGGDCQALNATMRGLALTLYRNVKDVEIIGFIDGYKGLMYEKYKKMKPKDFYDILNVGGSILGNSRCPFKRMRIIENGFDKVKAIPAYPFFIFGKEYFVSFAKQSSILAHSFHTLMSDASAIISAMCAPPTLDDVSRK